MKQRLVAVRPYARTLLACVAVGLAGHAVGCSGADRRDGEDRDDRQQSAALLRAGPYAVGSGVLYRTRGDSQEALFALPGAGPAADTLTPGARPATALGAVSFRRLTLAPDSAWAAWETGGPGAWVGVVGPSEPAVRVLAHWSGAMPDSLLWAPTGRFLAVRVRHPEGRHSLEVYDAVGGGRVEMPWEVDCLGVEGCDVTHVEWLGNTLLDVEIRLGPDEPSVPIEVNVAPALGVGGSGGFK